MFSRTYFVPNILLLTAFLLAVTAGCTAQHAGGQTFAQDAQIMGWLFQAESGR